MDMKPRKVSIRRTGVRCFRWRFVYWMLVNVILSIAQLREPLVQKVHLYSVHTIPALY